MIWEVCSEDEYMSYYVDSAMLSLALMHPDSRVFWLIYGLVDVSTPQSHDKLRHLLQYILTLGLQQQRMDILKEMCHQYMMLDG